MIQRPFSPSSRAAMLSCAARSALAAMLISGAGAAPALAQAASQPPVATNDRAATQWFDVPAGPTPTVLNAFAAQAGLEILYPYSAIGHHRSTALRGAFTSSQALQRILADTPLVVAERNGRTVTLKLSGAEPATLGDVVVTGRADRAEWLKQNEDRAVSTVSGAALMRIPAANVVEALSHLPGVTAYSDMGLGMAATGEREFLTIRGMDSSYNAYLLNGVRAPSSDPNTRALSLKMLAPYGFADAAVNKVPLSEDNGDAIGGTLTLRTPNAFDFGDAMGKITVAGHFAQLAEQRGADATGGAVQMEGARRFGGQGQFGAYAAVYYDRRNTVGEATEALGYLHALESELTTANWRDALRGGVAPRGVRYDYYENRTSRYGGSLALDYRGLQRTAYLRGTYGAYDTVGSDNQLGVYASLAAAFGVAPDYMGGKLTGLGVMPTGYHQFRDQQDRMWTLQAGGTEQRGRLDIDYSLSHGLNYTSRPDYVEGSLYNMPNFTGGVTTDLGDPARPVVRYQDPASRAYVTDPENLRLWKFQGGDSASENAMTGLKINLNYRLERGVLNSVKVGLNANKSDREQYDRAFFRDNGNFVILNAAGIPVPLYMPAGPALAAVPGRVVKDAFDGAYDGVFKVLDRGYFVDSVTPYKYTDQYGVDETGARVGNPGAYTQNDYNGNTVEGSETVLAGYVQAKLNIGALTVTPGLRYEHTKFEETHWVKDGAGYFAASDNDYGLWLPGVNAAYRPDGGRWVYRGSVRKSFSRPAFGLLAAPQSVSYDELRPGVARAVSLGNPTLSPTEAINYDASAQYYGRDGALFEISAYYKSLSHFIYTAAATGGGAAAANGESLVPTGVAPVRGADSNTLYIQPQNGADAWIYGLEVNARRKLGELPGLLGDVTLGGNVSLQRSEADSGRADHFGRKTWLPRSPELMSNVNVGFDHGPVRANLIYQYVGLQLLSLTSNNLDAYLQPQKRLDASLSYEIGRLSFDLAVQNLTDQPAFYKTLGQDTTYLGVQDGGGNGSYVNTGRMFSFTTRYRW